jgi:phosphoesterase RecJ-like protein
MLKVMIMIPDRMKRVNEACKEALGEILQKEIKDPRVGFVTVTEVEVSPDFKQAKVGISVLGDSEEVEKTLEGLEKAKGFLRRELGNRVRLRYTPELKIHLDRSAEVSERVQGLLHDLEEKRDIGLMEDIIDALQVSGRIGIASHINPDGDSIGSLLGLAMILQRQGKDVCASLPDPQRYPPQYLFLPGRELLGTPKDFAGSLEVFVALDCSNNERLGELRQSAESAETLVNIDHHEDNMMYGDINFVDEKISSTAELIYRILIAAGWALEPEVATCLYTGLMTDTGRFQHRNTTPETFDAASEMVEAGADIFRVVREIYENQSLSYTHLVGKALQRVEVREECGLIYSYVTQGDLDETGASLSETEDLIDYLRVVRGTNVVALFKELEDGKVRVSLRSRDTLEVGPIARAMGGGGHAMAAGYTSDVNIEKSIDVLVGVLRDARR